MPPLGSPPSDSEVANRIVALLKERRELVCRDLERGPTRPFSAGRHRVYTLTENGSSENGSRLNGWPPWPGTLSAGRRDEPSDR